MSIYNNLHRSGIEAHGSSIVRYKSDSCHANSGTVNDLARQ